MKKTALNIFFLLLSVALSAQEFDRTYTPTLTYTADKSLYSDYVHSYADTLRANFKKVTETKYRIYDTGKIRREFDEQYHEEYNDKRQNTLFVYWTDSLHPNDSTRRIYDDHYRLIRELQYKWDDSLKVMERTFYETKAYTAKGLLAKDSTYSIDTRYTNDYGNKMKASDGEYEKKVHLYSYDNEGNMVKHKILNLSGYLRKKEHIDDSTTIFFNYDSHGRETSGFNRYNWREYYTYSPTGKELYYCYVRLSFYLKHSDSTWTVSKYDARDSLIEREHFEQGFMDSRYSMKFDSGGGRTKTEEKFTEATLFACANDEMKITVLDKDDNILSISTSNLDKGKPESSLKRYFYKIRNGKVVYDSSATTEFSFLHTLTSEKVEEDTFDVHGNCLRTVNRGGGQYSSSGRETAQYNSKNKIVYSKTYNSCITDIPEKEEVFTYYADSTSIKEHVFKNDGRNEKSEYGPDGRILRCNETSHYSWSKDENTYETGYEYDK